MALDRGAMEAKSELSVAADAYRADTMSDMDTDDPGIEWVRELYEAHGPQLLRVASDKLRNADTRLDTAEDAVATVFTTLVRSRNARTSAAKADNPEAYVTRAVTNACVDQIRKNKQPTVPFDEDHDELPGSSADGVADAVELSEMATTLDEAMASLTPKQRYAVSQVHLHNRSRAAVGRDLGVSGEAVRKLEQKALAKLRDHPTLQPYSSNDDSSPT